MELLGAQRCFDRLHKEGINLSTFVSDRHAGIAKWVKTNETNTRHYFDIWHVAKAVCKKVFAAGREKGFEKLQRWVKGIRRHLYWCVLSTKQGFGALIGAKWESILRHIAGKHDYHENQLFPKCAHQELEKRKVVKIGTYQLKFSPSDVSKFVDESHCLQ